MKHRLISLLLLIVFIGVVGTVQAGKTAVLHPLSPAIPLIIPPPVLDTGIWQSSGPRGGKANALVVSPDFANDGLAFTGEWFTNYIGNGSGSSILKSTDFGQTWAESAAGTTETSGGTAVHDYAFSPNFTTDQIVFAATGGGLFQSTDGGNNWLRNTTMYDGGWPGIVDNVVVAPDYPSSGHIMATGGYGSLFVSQDNGISWTTPLTNLVSSIAYSPAFAADNTAFVTESYYEGQSLQHVVKTEDRGVTWTEVYSAAVNSVAVSPNYANDETLFAGGNQFHISSDGGTTWVTRPVSAANATILSLAVSPHYALDETIFAGAAGGLYQSTDGGNSWQEVPGYEHDTVYSLAISPQWPSQAMLLVGTDKGVFRLLTTDIDIGETREATLGLTTMAASVLAITPDESLLLAGTYNHGVFASEDGGNSWQTTTVSASGYSYSAVRALVFSPNYALDQTIFMAGGEKYTSYSRSVDGGTSWQILYSIYNNPSLAVSPDFAHDQTVFATGEDTGEFKKSTDGGDTWEYLTTWDRNRGGISIVLPPDYPGSGRIFIGANDFWYSPDNGSTWQQAAPGLIDSYFIRMFKVSPNFAVDQTLLAIAAYNQQVVVFKSVDAGVNWTLSNDGLPNAELRNFAFSPNFATDQTVYLVTPHELYRSLTAGDSWTLVGAPPESPELHDLLVDSAGRVFVSSVEGVWRFMTVAQDLIVNGRFETIAAWELPHTPIPANYTPEIVHTGQLAMRIGLMAGTDVNGYSSARQKTVALPADPLLAQLTFYVYPKTGEKTAVVPPVTNPETITRGDAQYVLLYSDTGTYLQTLYWDLSNAQTWQKHTVDLSHYGGQKLLLHFGVVNDGQNGATGMVIDDVSLVVIDGSRFPERVYLPAIMK